MEQILARVVNKAYAGEPEHACLQDVETNRIFEFSQIKVSSENNINSDVSLVDTDLNQPEIQRILNNNHYCNITFDDDGNVTVYF
jgi:hypothetical protein